MDNCDICKIKWKCVTFRGDICPRTLPSLYLLTEKEEKNE